MNSLDLNALDEISLYFVINECGGFIWRMNHDMADGRIPIESHDAIDKDIAGVRRTQQDAVSLLPKFGVDQPTQGPSRAPTEEYWKWFRWWDSYIKGLSEKEWEELNKKISNKEDYSKYRPQGDWKDPVSKESLLNWKKV